MEKQILAERIERRIYMIRGHRVMLDSDLAELYQVKTFNLNKAVKRNSQRFPSDFMFQLTAKEMEFLRFQIGISKTRCRGGRRYLPFAFTEQGVAMLSSILHSERAAQVNIEIMRTFVRFRHFLTSHADLAQKLKRLEKKYDGKFKVVFDALRELMEPSTPLKPRIGFKPPSVHEAQQAVIGKHKPRPTPGKAIDKRRRQRP